MRSDTNSDTVGPIPKRFYVASIPVQHGLEFSVIANPGPGWGLSTSAPPLFKSEVHILTTREDQLERQGVY